jgi:hypothetical protein
MALYPAAGKAFRWRSLAERGARSHRKIPDSRGRFVAVGAVATLPADAPHRPVPVVAALARTT